MYNKNKLEALQADAETRFNKENMYRAEALVNLLQIDVNKEGLFQYLTKFNERILEMSKHYSGLDIIIEEVSHDRKIVPWEQKTTKAKWVRAAYIILELIDYPQYPTISVDYKLAERIGYKNPVFFKSIVSGLRTSALLYCHFTGEDSREIMKRRLVYNMASSYDSYDLNIPLSLRMMLTAEDIKELEKDNSDDEMEIKIREAWELVKQKMAVRVQKEIKKGVHPGMAKRREQIRAEKCESYIETINNQDQAGHKSSLDLFLADYPDPRILIDELL